MTVTGEVGRLGDYRLLRLLGSGGMGNVYFGVSSTGDRAAVKVIRQELVSDDNLRRRFATEIENLRLVYGSRVARLEDADPLGDPAWLAVEYVPGATVNQYVGARGPLPVRLAAMAGAMLADGLGRVHQAGVLHRDLKPQNVILGPDGPVLIDFGLAVLTEQGSRHTQTGLLIGTPAYMSPEQVRGERLLTPAVDIYALGATLVYATTGHELYPGTTGVHSLLLRITDPEVAPDLTGVPAELTPVLTDMLAHDPAARPSLSAVRTRLLAVASADGTDVTELRHRIAELTYTAATELLVPRVGGRPSPATTGSPPQFPPSPADSGETETTGGPSPTRPVLPPAPTRADGASAPPGQTRTDVPATVASTRVDGGAPIPARTRVDGGAAALAPTRTDEAAPGAGPAARGPSLGPAPLAGSPTLPAGPRPLRAAAPVPSNPADSFVADPEGDDGAIETLEPVRAPSTIRVANALAYLGVVLLALFAAFASLLLFRSGVILSAVFLLAMLSFGWPLSRFGRWTLVLAAEDGLWLRARRRSAMTLLWASLWTVSVLAVDGRPDRSRLVLGLPADLPPETRRSLDVNGSLRAATWGRHTLTVGDIRMGVGEVADAIRRVAPDAPVWEAPAGTPAPPGFEHYPFRMPWSLWLLAGVAVSYVAAHVLMMLLVYVLQK
ncbi:serine/threonine-protein kinase [Micromonospora citrea]|uniref:serine/threonine-protein kinase n=1 Tax=Micromonospora citrea TaxID=47855 RepID=UPI000A87BAF7|nr:serine/threonine-protein kinase [Micromonospora citrea]